MGTVTSGFCPVEGKPVAASGLAEPSSGARHWPFVYSGVCRKCINLWAVRVSAGFAPGSEFRPVSLHTPGLATAPSSLRLPAPLEGPGHAFPGMPAHRDRCSQDIGLCPARPCAGARGGRPSTAAGSDDPARPFRGLQRASTSRLARFPPKPRPDRKPASFCRRSPGQRPPICP